MPDGRLLKTEPARPAWGKGKEFIFYIPKGWRNRKKAINDLIFLLYIKNENSLFIVPLVIKLELRKEFSPVRIFKLIKNQDIISGPTNIGMDASFDLEQYIIEKIDYYIKKCDKQLENILSEGLLKGDKNSDIVMRIVALIETVLPETTFNKQRVRISLDESMKFQIVRLGLWDDKSLLSMRVG